MNLFSKAKRPLAVAALTLTLALSTASLPQQVGGLKFKAGSTSAAARRFRVVWYFSDASHTTRVGIGTFRCNGIATLSGRSTQFSEEVANEPCCGNEVC
jgi:hypothetical protein